jgi:hypothetical protein
VEAEHLRSANRAPEAEPVELESHPSACRIVVRQHRYEMVADPRHGELEFMIAQDNDELSVRRAYEFV